MEVIVLIGDTGVGKTSWAYEHYPELYSVPCPKGSGTYWDGYQQQETVLIDEMSGSRFAYTFLLRLLDRYPMTVPVHGGQVPFSSRRVILTSNVHPSEWYELKDRQHNVLPFEGGPLYRRMTQGASRLVRVDPGGVHVTLAGRPEGFVGPLMPENV